MTLRRLGDFAVMMLVFVAAGPLIGLLAAAGTSMAGLFFSRWAEFAGHFPAFMLLYGWVFAHFVGLAPAALAGAMVAAYAAWRGRVPLLAGAAAGLGSGILLNRLTPFDPKAELAPIVFVWIATHVVAAVACTRLTRRWQ